MEMNSAKSKSSWKQWMHSVDTGGGAHTNARSKTNNKSPTGRNKRYRTKNHLKSLLEKIDGKFYKHILLYEI